MAERIFPVAFSVKKNFVVFSIHAMSTGKSRLSATSCGLETAVENERWIGGEGTWLRSVAPSLLSTAPSQAAVTTTHIRMMTRRDDDGPSPISEAEPRGHVLGDRRSVSHSTDCDNGILFLFT